MALGPESVYKQAIEATFRALRTIPQQSVGQTYRLAVHTFVQLVALNHRIPSSYVNRTNFDIALALAIIRATYLPTSYTGPFLDHLQNLGLFIFEEVRPNRDLWFEEIRATDMMLDNTDVLILEADRYLERIGNRDWRGRWAQGTLIEDRLRNENGSANHAAMNQARRGSQDPSAEFILTVAGHPRLASSAGTMDNARGQESELRPVDVNNAVMPPASNGAASSSNSPPTSNSGRSVKKLPAAKSAATKKRAPASGARRGPTARPAVRNDPNNPLTERASNGTTTWATNMGGRLVEFGRHVRGQQRPWTCLLGDTFTSSERGGLTTHLQQRHQMDPADLAHMQVDNPNLSNFEGHDDKDCFFWGEFVHGDPAPWKCLLCKEKHKGCKDGRNTLGRHILGGHGIRVILPPITRQEMDHHHKKKVKSGAWARQVAALENLEERRAAAAAQEAANQAGLVLSLMGGGTGVKRSASDTNLDGDSEGGEEDEREDDDDVEMEDWLARATGGYLEEGDDEDDEEDDGE